MKKVFFIASRYPLPVNGGREKTLIEYLSFLQSTNVEVFFYFFGDSQFSSDELMVKFNCIKQVKRLDRPSFFVSIFNLIVYTFLLRKLSIQESFYFYKKTSSFLLSEFNKENPDIVFFDMIRTAPYFYNKQYNNALTVFDMDDMLSKRYDVLSKIENKNLLGNFSKLLPAFLSLIANKLLKFGFLKLESILVSKNEIKYATYFNKTLLVSPIEAQQLRLKLNNPKSLDIFSLYPSACINLVKPLDHDTKIIVFMGLLNMPHNRDALTIFLDEIFPIIKNKFQQEFRFLILGGGADKELLDYSTKFEGVNFLGFVPDIHEVLSGADVFIAPVYFGTGIKLKVLDALGMGLPLVTTSVGAEGLLLQHGVNCLIADDYDDFAESVVSLLSDSALRKTLANGALNYALEHHDFNQLQSQFLKVLEISNDN